AEQQALGVAVTGVVDDHRRLAGGGGEAVGELGEGALQGGAVGIEQADHVVLGDAAELGEHLGDGHGVGGREAQAGAVGPAVVGPRDQREAGRIGGHGHRSEEQQGHHGFTTSRSMTRAPGISRGRSGSRRAASARAARTTSSRAMGSSSVTRKKRSKEGASSRRYAFGSGARPGASSPPPWRVTAPAPSTLTTQP